MVNLAAKEKCQVVQPNVSDIGSCSTMGKGERKVIFGPWLCNVSLWLGTSNLLQSMLYY